MSGFSVASNEHLIRSNLWSNQLKEIFEDDLLAMRYVDTITDFPDGQTIHIPSIGQAEIRDYTEGQAMTYTSMDTGDFTFQITDYKSSATYITTQMLQDSFYAQRAVSSFVPKMNRALAKAMEVSILNVPYAGQTASNTNTINGAFHRFVGSGTNNTIGIADFAKARYALEKANVPMNNLVAIVDPSVEYTLATQTNIVQLQNNPQWEGIVRDGVVTGTQFRFNIYGFDVYVSQNLKTGLSETVNSVAVTNGVNNIFFSADSTALPIVGAIRQAPKVDSEYNKDFQREEYVTTCRYGFKLFRPENMVSILTDTSRVYS